MLERQESGSVVTDEAVEAATKALAGTWTLFEAVPTLAVEAGRVALEAAAPLLGPKPLLDRETVLQVVAERIDDLDGVPAMGSPADHLERRAEHVTEAVMELARPMPTRERIKQVLHIQGAWCGDCDFETGGCSDCDHVLGKYADAVLALLNGAES